MKLQFDTTIQIHRLLQPCDDAINVSLNSLIHEAESVEVSTYTKKEFAFSIISDCCIMLARLNRTKSLSDALKFIDAYGYHKKRFRGRMLSICWKFFVRQTIKDKWQSYSENERDRILADEFTRFLRLYIPELWDSFEKDIKLPLQDRTKCPFAHKPPVDNGKTFEIETKRKCDASLNCALPNMMHGERTRALMLLEKLRELDNCVKTRELEKIEIVLEGFFEKNEEDICLEMCNQGIGDLIVALETMEDRTLVTTNAKETNIISPAISQQYVVLPIKTSD